MLTLAKKLEIQESPTVKINDLAKTKSDVVNFAAGDLKIHSPGYPPVAGLLDLRQEASSWMNDRYQSSYQVNETVVTPGGKFALYAILMAILNPEDEVIVSSPYWVSYIPMVHLCLGSIKIVQSNHDWKITPDILEKNASAKLRVLIFNNANNPTGILYSKDEVKSILEWAKKRNCLVLSDEVYSELVYDDEKFYSCALFKEHKDHVAIVESCSKNFAMPDIRVGFAFAPKNLIDAIIKLLGQTTTGVAVSSQNQALNALKNWKTISYKLKIEMKKRRDLFVETYQKQFSLPLKKAPSSLYQFVPVKEKSEDFCLKALEKGVIAVPGTAFGKEGYVRFAFCEDEKTIVEGLRRLSCQK